MWVIDREIENYGDDVPKYTYRRFKSPDFNKEEFKSMKKTRFRLRDDDNIVYFEGWIGDADKLNEEKLLEPADGIGMNSGAFHMDLLKETTSVIQMHVREKVSNLRKVSVCESRMVTITIEKWEPLNG